MTRLTFGSLFAGVGGIDLGLERAGMQCAWQVEIDPKCRAVLARHWPEVERYEDVRECGSHNLPAVDVVAGGFPCQPVSVAGKRRGREDKRWLWPEFYRVIRELKPRWALAENVVGLLSADDGRLFGGILRDLAACGYDVEWDCIPASAVGAPHVRDRVWLVAYTARGGAARQGKSDEDARPGLAGGGSGLAGETTNAEMAHADGARLAQPEPQRKLRGPVTECSWWQVEPGVGRMADGFPGRVDRLRMLGNAVVPQVAEWIGRRIVAAEAGL